MRTLLLVCACAIPLAAGNGNPVVDLFSALASSLSEGNPVAFMRPFDPAMPGLQTLRDNVTALLLQADVSASLEFLSDEGDDAHRSVAVDWLMQVRDKEDNGPLVRRHQTVKARLERRGRKWIVTAMEPIDLFAPPRVRR